MAPRLQERPEHIGMLGGVLLCAAIVLNVAVAVPTTPQPVQTTTPNPVPGGPCTRTVSGMTTCTILNTATVLDDSSLSLLEKAVDVAYSKSVSDKNFKDTPASKTVFSNYFCVLLATTFQAAPCDRTTGKALRACYELCSEYNNILNRTVSFESPLPDLPMFQITEISSVDKVCNASVKMEGKCFGTKGITDVTFLDTALGVVSSWRVCAKLIFELCFNGVDIATVVLTIVFQLHTYIQLDRWTNNLRDDDNENKYIRWMMRMINPGLFVVFNNWFIVAFAVGKLFPPKPLGYFCSTDRCSKVVHNAVMTLASFPFDLWEVVMLDDAAKKAPIPSRRMLFCKLFQTMIPFLYLMWDSARESEKGGGSITLVVFSALSCVVVFGFQLKTLYKTYLKALSDPDNSAEADDGRDAGRDCSDNDASAEIGHTT